MFICVVSGNLSSCRIIIYRSHRTLIQGFRICCKIANTYVCEYTAYEAILGILSNMFTSLQFR